MVTIPLRDFLDQRERDIKEGIRAFRAELAEVRLARAALSPPTAGIMGDGEPEATIKDMVRAVLNGEGFGLASNEIIDKIEREFGKVLERTSLSPQLSRLRKDGDVTWTAGRWYLAPDVPAKVEGFSHQPNPFEDYSIEIERSSWDLNDRQF